MGVLGLLDIGSLVPELHVHVQTMVRTCTNSRYKARVIYSRLPPQANELVH